MAFLKTMLSLDGNNDYVNFSILNFDKAYFSNSFMHSPFPITQLLKIKFMWHNLPCFKNKKISHCIFFCLVLIKISCLKT